MSIKYTYSELLTTKLDQQRLLLDHYVAIIVLIFVINRFA